MSPLQGKDLKFLLHTQCFQDHWIKTGLASSLSCPIPSTTSPSVASTTQLVPTPSPCPYYNNSDNNSNAVSSWLWSYYYVSGTLMHYLF